MNQEQLKIKNDMLAKISALRASIDALKITDGKEYKELLKSNEKILEKVEAEYKIFIDKAQTDRLAEIKRQQELSQKILRDDIMFVGKFLAMAGKMKLEDQPDPKLLEKFNQIKRKAHVIHHLRKLNLKGI